MLLPKISISIVTFKNHNAIIQLSNKSLCDIFFKRFSSIKFNPRFSLYVRNSFLTKHVYWVTFFIMYIYILKLTPIHTKPIFNTYTH